MVALIFSLCWKRLRNLFLVDWLRLGNAIFEVRLRFMSQEEIGIRRQRLTEQYMAEPRIPYAAKQELIRKLKEIDEDK